MTLKFFYKKGDAVAAPPFVDDAGDYSQVLHSLVEYVAPAPLVTTEVLMGKYPSLIFFVARKGSPGFPDTPVILLSEVI